MYRGTYRGTSQLTNSGRLGPYGRTLPRAIWQSQGGGLFLMSEVPLCLALQRDPNSSVALRYSSHPSQIIGVSPPYPVSHERTSDALSQIRNPS